MSYWLRTPYPEDAYDYYGTAINFSFEDVYDWEMRWEYTSGINEEYGIRAAFVLEV